jgi:cellulose synthase (UDP-forming)
MLEGNYAAALAVVAGLIFTITALFRPAVPFARATVCYLSAIAALVYIDWRVEHLSQLLGEPATSSLWSWIFALAEFLCLAEFLVFMLLMSRSRDNGRLAAEYERKLRSGRQSDLPEVDVWIATYDEEWTILEKTLVGALHIDYPREKFRIWVLDDGRRDWLRDRCRELGVEHVTRPDNKGKKAGNHNHALQVTRAPFILSLDADFVPFPNIIFRLLGFFEDPSVGIVQTPQTYYNTDVIRKNLRLHLAPDELAFFYREIQPARDAWDAAFYCGSCAVLRRSALQCIGGFVTETDIEDQATSVKLLANGYKTRFLNETLSVGLAAESSAVFHDQRNRWCRGSIQLVFTSFGPFGRGLNLWQRLFFVQTPWIVWSVAPIIFYLTPALLWLFGWNVYSQAEPNDVLLIPLLLFAAICVSMGWLSRLHWVPVLSAASQIFMAFELAPTAVLAFLKPFGKPLIKIMPVTPKGASASLQRIDLRTFSLLLGLTLVTLSAFLYSILTDYIPVHHSTSMIALSFWTLYTLSITSIACLMCIELPYRQAEERFRVSQPVRIMLTDGGSECGVALDVSLTGARIRLNQHALLTVGQWISLDIPTIGRISASVAREDRSRNEFGLKFESLDQATRHALIRAIFTDARIQSVTLKFSAKPLFVGLLRRFVGIAEEGRSD